MSGERIPAITVTVSIDFDLMNFGDLTRFVALAKRDGMEDHSEVGIEYDPGDDRTPIGLTFTTTR